MRNVLLILLVCGCISFHTKKNKRFVPPGTAQITETFYADETEVSNFSWREYELWIKTKYGSGSKEHLETLPDTLVWRDPAAYNEPYVNYYYRHFAYKDYPVVGVSYEQVIAFCKWRTERVREYYSIAFKKKIDLEYTLPSKEQWEFLSNNGIGIFSNNGRNQKGLALINCRRENDTLIVTGAESQDILAPVYSYYKNRFGLYNTVGNVSEMVLEKGISKGGSWHHRLEDCRIGKDLVYAKQESWLGFRCVCTLRQL